MTKAKVFGFAFINYQSMPVPGSIRYYRTYLVDRMTWCTRGIWTSNFFDP